MKNFEYDISVLVITYNQEKYLPCALDSILMQKTKQRIEVLIGEDCSTDDTRKLLLAYSNKYAGAFEVIYNIVNLGAAKNTYNLLSMAKGQYITILEGDDYWIGENRLQSLYDFLEKHTECSAVSHVRERHNSMDELIGYDPENDLLNSYIAIDDYMGGANFSITGSMFRNVFLENSETYMKALTVARNACDFSLCCIILQNGSVYILDKVFGVYRVLTGNMNSNYCAITSQLQVDLDYILQHREIGELYGANRILIRRMSELIFDGMLFCTKRRMIQERKEFSMKLTFKEKRNYIISFPVNLVRRIIKHIRYI